MTTMPEIDFLQQGLLRKQEKLGGSHKLAQARRGAGWEPNLWFLPLCPPTNSLYPGKERRYKSEKYKAWLAEAEAYWLYQLVQKRAVGVATGNHPTWTFPKGEKEKWSLDIYSFMPTYRDGDLDGRLKALIDFLVQATGHDDRYLSRLHAERITDSARLRGCAVVFGGVK